MINLAICILYLYPTAEPVRDFLVFDDGTGQKITLWNVKDAQGETVPEPTIEELEAVWSEAEKDYLLKQIRTIRDKKLKASDFTVLPDVPLTADKKLAWETYRQQLRDMPETCDPNNPIWPTEPI